MEWTRDRFENTIPGAVLAKMNRLLLDLRGSQVDGDMAAVSAGSASLLRVTSQI
jgi:hypothetical protein